MEITYHIRQKWLKSFMVVNMVDLSAAFDLLKLVMSSRSKCLTWVVSDWVSHLWVWKISPENPNFLNFFCLDQKKSHRSGSKNTQVKDGSHIRLFTAGHRSMLELDQFFVAWVRLSQASLIW